MLVKETKKTMERERWATEEAFLKGNVGALDEVFDADCVFHTPPLLPSYNLKQFKQFALGMLQSMSDIQWSWDDVVIEGNTAAQRFTIRAKHTGTVPFIPVPPTGKEVVIVGCGVYHLKNGKVIEFFEYSDFLGFFQQLGIVPPMAMK
jgi:predicted ester cyclase